MDRRIFIDGYLGLETATIPEMLEILQRTYCSTIGIEFMHISDPEEKSWLQERIEGPDKGVAFTNEGKKAILAKLIEAETFERFLHKRYPGTKRFGLDGGEAAVPALEQIIKRGGALGVEGNRGRHAAPRTPQHAGRRDGQALRADLPRIPGRQHAGRRPVRLRRREIPPRCLLRP
jgi:hypothetical protein